MNTLLKYNPKDAAKRAFKDYSSISGYSFSLPFFLITLSFGFEWVHITRFDEFGKEYYQCLRMPGTKKDFLHQIVNSDIEKRLTLKIKEQQTKIKK